MGPHIRMMYKEATPEYRREVRNFYRALGVKHMTVNHLGQELFDFWNEEFTVYFFTGFDASRDYQYPDYREHNNE